jgi:hypothetical protein
MESDTELGMELGTEPGRSQDGAGDGAGDGAILEKNYFDEVPAKKNLLKYGSIFSSGPLFYFIIQRIGIGAAAGAGVE